MRRVWSLKRCWGWTRPTPSHSETCNTSPTDGAAVGKAQWVRQRGSRLRPSTLALLPVPFGICSPRHPSCRNRCGDTPVLAPTLSDKQHAVDPTFAGFVGFDLPLASGNEPDFGPPDRGATLPRGLSLRRMGCGVAGSTGGD